MSIRATVLGLLGAAALSLSLADCSTSGGSANVARTPAPTPTATTTVAPLVFTGSSIVNNVMALPCNTAETFTIAEAGYSGTFTLVPSSPDLMITPSSLTGTSSTVFSVIQFETGVSQTFTITATGATSGVLTINFTTGEACG
jgi:hypothetical protein